MHTLTTVAPSAGYDFPNVVKIPYLCANQSPVPSRLPRIGESNYPCRARRGTLTPPTPHKIPGFVHTALYAESFSFWF